MVLDENVRMKVNTMIEGVRTTVKDNILKQSIGQVQIILLLVN